jgi:hypothetical protein
MAYQFYTVRQAGHLETLPIAFFAPNDAGAIAEAKKRLNGHELRLGKATGSSRTSCPIGSRPPQLAARGPKKIA